MTSPTDTATAARQRWMSALAQAPRQRLEDAWQALSDGDGYTFLRPPETGLVMTRGRSGGSGLRFNLGEMTVTRAAVRLTDGTVGHAYIAGRDRRRAELAAAFDALLQHPERRNAIDRTLISPLLAERAAARLEAARKAAATKVEFFTMVRGED